MISCKPHIVIFLFLYYSDMDAPPVKRYRRREEEESRDSDDFAKEGDDYVPYVPVRERRKQKLVKLGRIAVLKEEERASNSDLVGSSGASSANEDDAKEDLIKKEEEILAKSKETSLLLQHSQLKKLAEAKQESEMDKMMKEEEKILESVKQQTALMGVNELARGTKYTDPIKTGWTVPRFVAEMPAKRHERLRRRKNIIVEGVDPPPPLKTFEDMKFPRGILNALQEKKIEKPSPIQMQGIPAILLGRDLVSFIANVRK